MTEGRYNARIHNPGSCSWDNSSPPTIVPTPADVLREQVDAEERDEIAVPRRKYRL